MSTTARVVSNDTELDNEQRILIEAIKHDIGACEDVTVLARFAEKMGLALPGRLRHLRLLSSQRFP